MQATKKIIEQYYDYFNQGDMSGFLSLLDDNIAHDANQGERKIGKKIFAAFMERMNRSYKEQIKNLLVMVNEDGTRAAAEFVVEGVYLVTDEGLPAAKQQKYSLPCGAFFEVKNGKITRITHYYNLNDWLKQVGAK